MGEVLMNDIWLIAVLCEKERTFKTFLNEVHPEDHSKFFMVNRVERAHGVRFIDFIKLWDYRNVRDCEEIIYILTSKIELLKSKVFTKS